MSQTILGIDLGTYSLKILRLERHVQELRLLDFFELPLDLHARTPHDEQVTEVLGAFFNEHSLDADIVCMNLPGHLLSSRIVDVPFVGQKKINQALDFELEGHLPFPIEDIFWDYHVIKEDENSSEVLCAYTHEANIGKYLSCLESINIDAKYLGADFADFASIAQVAILPPEGFYALCDIGHSKTTLLIMDGPQLKYARTIGVGGYHFTRAIQRAFNLNYEKAEALKLTRGKLYLREQESDQVSRILSHVAAELISAIKQTYMGAAKYYGNITVPAVYCCGGGTKLIGILEHLSFHLQTNFFELDALTFTAHHFEDADDINRAIPQVLSTAIRPIYFHRIPRINFRKGPYAYKQDIQIVTREFKSVIVFVFLIAVLVVTYYFIAENHYSEKITKIDRTVDKLMRDEFKDITVAKRKRGAKKDDTENLLKKYLKSVKTKINEYESVSSGGSSEAVLNILYEISTKLPPKQAVNFETKEFVFAEDFVRLSATTNDTLNVEKIIESLRKSEMFSEVSSTDAQPKPGGLWDFTLKIDLRQAARSAD
ncbi:MAG: pilus assembly protein PilM [bacterium]|nr:pilus assembly protein PilM [bacterium]MBU1917008.1 pilus assembly protein PilM [bacterium]